MWERFTAVFKKRLALWLRKGSTERHLHNTACLVRRRNALFPFVVCIFLDHCIVGPAFVFKIVLWIFQTLGLLLILCYDAGSETLKLSRRKNGENRGENYESQRKQTLNRESNFLLYFKFLIQQQDCTDLHA